MDFGAIMPLVELFGPWGVLIALLVWQQLREDKRRDAEVAARLVEAEVRLEADKEINRERQHLTAALTSLGHFIQGLTRG